MLDLGILRETRRLGVMVQLWQGHGVGHGAKESESESINNIAFQSFFVPDHEFISILQHWAINRPWLPGSERVGIIVLYSLKMTYQNWQE